MDASSQSTAANSTTASSPLEHCAPSSHSSNDSHFCSPASFASRPPPSSGDTSPGEGVASGQLGDRGGSVAKADSLSNTAPFSRRFEVHQRRSPLFPNSLGRVIQQPSNVQTLSFTNPELAMTSTSEAKLFSSFSNRPSSSTAASTGLEGTNEAEGSLHGEQSGPSRAVAIPPRGKTERPASKSRRMSPGGSRMPSEDPGDRQNGSGRSASDSGSDWQHGVKTHLQHAQTDLTAQNGSASTGDSDRLGSGSWVHLAPASDGHGSSRSDGDDGTRQTLSSRKVKDVTSPQPLPVTRPHLDLATFPPQDLLRILATLLQQIATANDQLRPAKTADHAGSGASEGRRRRDREPNAAPEMALATPSGSVGSLGATRESSEQSDWLVDSRSELISMSQKPTTAALGALHTPSSTLCFRARNVPSISIEAYLLRILRYCPASCEVFVSLLVYFDRMSKMGQQGGVGQAEANSADESTSSADNDGRRGPSQNGSIAAGDDEDSSFVGMRGFAIDSFNVHRLVIAGVTVASKFFSDVFYTNSRYAKVGGLPVHELNQLELQFLLLNDFKLMIPLEEMQRYANQLLVYGEFSQQAPSSVRTTSTRQSGVGSSTMAENEAATPTASSAASAVRGDGSRTPERATSTRGEDDVSKKLAARASNPSGVEHDVHGDTAMGDA